MKNKLFFPFMKSQKRKERVRDLLLLLLLIGFILILPVPTVKALEIYRDQGWTIRWDNNLKYSMGLRLADPRDDRMYDNPFVPAYNVDDGDRNFSQYSLISNRFDLLSEFDVTYHDFGVRLSAAGWVDTVYLQENDNDSWAMFNGFNLNHHDRFLSGTKDVHGLNVDLLDAFFFGRFNVADMPFSFRLGRHTLLWGETLFFGGNGIAHGMAPTDIVKLLSVPSTQFKELLMPIARFSCQLQQEKFTLAAFANFEWRRDRLPASGSYFSSVDVLDAGGRRFILGLNGLPYPWGPLAPALWRGNDMGGGSQTGSFGEVNFDSWGIAVRFRIPCVDADWGIYYHRYNETEPQVYGYLGKDVDALNAARGKAGEYFLVFPKHIHMIGVSFGTQFGDVNVSGELSGRINTPLASLPRIVNLFNPNAYADNNHHPAYAVGNTFHANLSATWLAGYGPSIGSFHLWEGGTLLAELGYCCLINITDNKNLLVTHSPDVRSADNMVLNPRNHPKHHALGFRGIWEPTYYQVVPGIDISVPFGFGYNFSGRSPVTAGFNGGADKGGDASVGITVTYNSVWKGGITYTNYFGSPNWQTLEDRDFVSFNINRTF